jgi:Ni2+-binding GTPase involved in maturation of urease and hydrogenase
MQLHLVGGFLGSGKTTAIAAACKALATRKLTAGVVANDQGKYLVDTAFYDSQKISTVQVAGGCFCCNYDDLAEKIDRLSNTVQPDVIFAEAVGSSADIVATVIKPLQDLKKPDSLNITFSVFADMRLFFQWVTGEVTPFGQKVMYLYGKQVEEAGLLVINKRDLVSPGRARDAMEDARGRFPQKQVRLQNSLDAIQIDSWLDELDGISKRPSALNSLSIDYNWYAAGKAALGWLDTHLDFQAQSTMDMRPLVIEWITGLDREFRQRNIPVGHIKVMLSAGKTEAKVSLTAGDTAGWRTQIPELRGKSLHALVNARMEADPSQIRQIMEETAALAAANHNCLMEEKDTEAFRPGFPKPKRRMM